MVFQQHIGNKNESKFYVIAIIALILMFYGVSVGINLTSFALFLSQEGFSKIQIGRILAFELAGNLMIAAILPKIYEYWSLFTIMMVGLIVRGLCLFMFSESSNLQEYMMWLFGFGIAGFSLFASIQFWGTSMAYGEHKATIISMLNVAFGVGIACGIGVLFTREGKITSELFYVSILFSGIILLPLFLLKKHMPIQSKQSTPLYPSKIIYHAQIPILCGLVTNYILLGLGNFIVLYAIEHGVEYKSAIMINLYMISGSILFTIPIGILIDKFNRTASLIVTLLILILALISIPYAINSYIYTIIVFLVIGTATGSIYVIGLTSLTDKFRTQNLAMANTVMLMMNAIGGFSGASATGAAIEYWGNKGLIISLSVLVFFFLLFVVYSLNNRK